MMLPAKHNHRVYLCYLLLLLVSALLCPVLAWAPSLRRRDLGIGRGRRLTVQPLPAEALARRRPHCPSHSTRLYGKKKQDAVAAIDSSPAREAFRRRMSILIQKLQSRLSDFLFHFRKKLRYLYQK